MISRFIYLFNTVIAIHDATIEICRCTHDLKLTLTVLVTTIDAQWEGMRDVGSVRYEPALLPHARP